MYGDKKYSFIVFSDDWARHPSSTQHIFRVISRNRRVLWVNTIGLRKPSFDTFTLMRGVEKLGNWTKPVKKINENLYVFDPPMLPVSGGGMVSRLNAKYVSSVVNRVARRLGMREPILWVSVPNAGDYIDFIDYSYLVYYVTDDYSHWPGADREKTKRLDRKLGIYADIIFPVCEELGKGYPEYKVRVLPHGVDFEHFSRTFSYEPEELKSIPHPRICFFGLIYEKLDFRVVKYLADNRKGYQLVFIGPVKVDVSELEMLDNVHFLGPKSYEELPKYLAFMDVFLIPYAKDLLSERSSPLKLKECFSVGKPVVALKIPDLSRYDKYVFLYENENELVSAVDDALQLSSEDIYLTKKMREFVKSDSWENRAEEIVSFIGKLSPVKVNTSVDGDDFYCKWARVYERAYGMKHFVVSADNGGEDGRIVLVKQKGILPGKKRLVGLPYLDYVDCHQMDIPTEDRIMREIIKLKNKLGCDGIEVRKQRRLLGGVLDVFVLRDDKVSFVLDLPDSIEELWVGLSPKVRNLIRKAERYGLAVSIGGGELLDKFYEIYFRTMKRVVSPPHSIDFFRYVVDEFGNDLQIFVVEFGGGVVASALTIVQGERLWVPWAGSLAEYKYTSANMYMYWEMIKWAVRKGKKQFDFGRCSKGSGTYRFKKQWGGEEKKLFWYYLPDRSGFDPENKIVGYLRKVWSILPDRFVKTLGGVIISRLS